MKRMTPEDLRASIEAAHDQLARTKPHTSTYDSCKKHLADLRDTERQWAKNSAKSLIEDDDR